MKIEERPKILFRSREGFCLASLGESEDFFSIAPRKTTRMARCASLPPLILERFHVASGLEDVHVDGKRHSQGTQEEHCSHDMGSKRYSNISPQRS
jgi:hypothetical protein